MHLLSIDCSIYNILIDLDQDRSWRMISLGYVACERLVRISYSGHNDASYIPIDTYELCYCIFKNPNKSLPRLLKQCTISETSVSEKGGISLIGRSSSPPKIPLTRRQTNAPQIEMLRHPRHWQNLNPLTSCCRAFMHSLSDAHIVLMIVPEYLSALTYYLTCCGHYREQGLTTTSYP